jgi:hypothetical protein
LRALEGMRGISPSSSSSSALIRKTLSPLLTLGLAVATFAIACGGSVTGTANPNVTADGGGGASGGDASANAGNGPIEPDVPLIPAKKVDLLLAVDNSASMGDKSKLLSASIGTLIREVAKVGDVHVGVVSSSLGNFGGNVCDSGNPRTNDRALLRSTDENGTRVPSSGPSGVLTFRTGDNVENFIKDASSAVRGVGETGCGFEAQLESVYRFLIAPDPWVTVRLDGNNQSLLGDDVDVDVLRQRADFLRPDSALVVVMITDEDDSSVDPLAVGGQGWAFQAREFPGSRVFRGNPKQGTTAPRGTSACSTNPNSADCTSCGFQSLCDPQQVACQRIRQDVNCTTSGLQGQAGDGYNGYYGATDDELNVRFHRMKERYGIDPQYPISRYVDAFTRFKVADRKSERTITTSPSGRRDVGNYEPLYKCTNPIFASSLPRNPGDEICSLPPGNRSRELVVFSVLGGVPEALAEAVQNDPDTGWTKVLGRDPGAFNFDGIDPHMIQSVMPRGGLPDPTSPGNGTDPIHGREWTTNKADLQYACTFPLATPRACTANDASCDCSPDRIPLPPLCGSPGEQTRGKAYPTPRILRVAHDLGSRGVIGSICASQGYDATMRTLFARLVPRLSL